MSKKSLGFAIVMAILSILMASFASAQLIGFRNAKIGCYDGTTFDEGGSTSCKTRSEWQTIAKDRCAGLCASDIDICGVKSFRTLNTCSAEQKCTDTDGGKDIYVRGMTQGHPSSSKKSIATYTDRCNSQNQLIEFFCTGPDDINDFEYVSSETDDCPNGCRFGKCLGDKPVQEASVSVVYPNGGESFNTGQNLVIQWATSGLGYNDTVWVNLYSTEGNAISKQTLFDKINNSGRVSWRIPNDLAAGDKYTIGMGCSDSNKFGDSCKSDKSDEVFSITKKSICGDGICSLNEICFKDCNQLNCTDTDGGKKEFVYGKTYLGDGTSGIYYDTCGADDAGNSFVDEYYCSAPSSVNSNVIKKVTINCLGDCKDGACINSTSPPTNLTVREDVKCVFKSRCLECKQKEEKCYTTDSTGEVKGCSGTGSCVATVEGTSGDILTWKSSCGGYAYSTMDGVNEDIYFSCGESSPVCGNGICETGEDDLICTEPVDDCPPCTNDVCPACIGECRKLCPEDCTKKGVTKQNVIDYINDNCPEVNVGSISNGSGGTINVTIKRQPASNKVTGNSIWERFKQTFK